VELAVASIAIAAAFGFFVWVAYQLDRPRKKPPQR
jgi:nitrate reductase NapE component